MGLEPSSDDMKPAGDGKDNQRAGLGSSNTARAPALFQIVTPFERYALQQTVNSWAKVAAVCDETMIDAVILTSAAQSAMHEIFPRMGRTTRMGFPHPRPFT